MSATESGVSSAALNRLTHKPWCTVIAMSPRWSETQKVRHLEIKLDEFRKKCAEGPCALLWRNNSGLFYPMPHGKQKRRAQPVIAGINGQADCSGVLYPSGRRLEDEHKTPAAKSARGDWVIPSAFNPAQKIFRPLMETAGAIYVAGWDADSIERAVEVAVFHTQFEPVAQLTAEQEASRLARVEELGL